MTEQELDAMVEIDARIHERIMGLTPTIVWIATRDGGKSCCLSSESKFEIQNFLGLYKDGMSKGCELGSWKRYPRYSSEPAASDALLNKIAEMGLAIVISKEPNVGWICEIGRDMNQSIRGRTWWTSRMTTKHMAIAEAALKAIAGAK